MNIKHISPLRRMLALLAVCTPIALTGAVALSGATASAQTVNAQQEQSANWAGYVAQAKSGQSFSSVSGSWTQPAVSGSGQKDSAFWVGLGGTSQQSQALEQIGTSANIVNGKAEYSAWYELVPAPETNLSLAIHPGDHISARVTVNGENVTLSLADQTTGQSVTKSVQMQDPNTSSAEWIAEAPSVVNAGGGTQILPLANFGTVTFTNASATAGGHTGSISDPDWTDQETQLSSSGAVAFPGAGSFTGGLGGSSAESSAGASPGGLADDGTSFSVSYSAGGGASQSPTGGGPGESIGGYGSGGSGYPGGYGYPSGYAHPGAGYGYPGYGSGAAVVLPGGYVVVIV